MGSLINTDNVSRLLTVSTGIFAGMNLGISLTAVPGILASNDPLPCWRIVYLRASKVAVTSLLTSTAASMYCLFKNEGGVANNAGYLASGILSSSIILYTLIFMKPINDHLFRINRNEDSKSVKEIVTKWKNFHWGRTIVGTAIFVLQVFHVGNSKLN